MKCSECKYCEDYGRGISGGYHCTHERVCESAEEYALRKGKRINKEHSFIGYNMIKTSLRYCPLKEVKEAMKEE